MHFTYRYWFLNCSAERVHPLERERMKELFLFKPNLRNIWIHSATCSCIFELLDYKRFFPQLPFFGGLLMYQRKISEVAMGPVARPNKLNIEAGTGRVNTPFTQWVFSNRSEPGKVYSASYFCHDWAFYACAFHSFIHSFFHSFIRTILLSFIQVFVYKFLIRVLLVV